MTPPEPATTRPNVLVFLTDDQGPWAMPGSWPDLVMPNVAELMHQGTTFDNFYCASPVCSPARATLMTGRMPSAHGVHDWLVGERHPDAAEDTYIGGLTTLPQALSKAGYTCGMSGKWHIGSSQWPAPGFDYWYAHRLGGGPYFGAPVWVNGEKVDEPRYFTDAVAEEASQFLSAMLEHEKPFYLQVNFTAPHTPWIDSHPQELYDIYDGCTFDTIPRVPRHPWSIPRNDFNDDFANPIPSLAGYAASLTGVDRAVGSLLDKLRDTGQLENTIVVFMADNGFSCGHHGMWGKGNGTWPLNFWENSVRVPFVIAGPGVPKGHTVADHVSAAGFFPTICDLTGVTAPEDPLRAGETFMPLVRGNAPGNGSDSVVVYDEYGGGRMIRADRFKYVDRYGDQPKELYDLDDDPDEEHNLVSDPGFQSIRTDLDARLHEWFAAHENPIDSAFAHHVRGYGQIHPPRKGYPDARTYVAEPVTLDGVADNPA